MSSGGTTLFKTESFRNQMKHSILGGYVPAALMVLMQRYRCDSVYGDLCAGPGLYDDGKLGSPLIIGRFAADRFAKGEPHLIRCFNVEANRASFKQLVENTKNLPAEVVINRSGNWQDHLNELLALMKDKPALLLLDPFGAKGMELDQLVKILSGVGSDAWEIIIRFDIGDLYRGNITQARAKQKAGETHNLYDLPNSVFGTDRWQALLDAEFDLPVSRFDDFLTLYLEQLSKAGGKPFQSRFVAPAPVLDELGGTTAYYLIFVTRSGKALTMFSDAVNIATERAWHAQEVAQAEEAKIAPQVSLFAPAEFIPSYDSTFKAFIDELEDAVATHRPHPWEVLFGDLHRDMAIRFYGRFREMHLRAVVKRARDAGKLDTDVTKIDPKTLVRSTGK